MHGWWGRGLEHMESEQGWWLDGDAGATTVSKSMQSVGRAAAVAVGGRRILWHDNAIHGECGGAEKGIPSSTGIFGGWCLDLRPPRGGGGWRGNEAWG
jgi:hypothetical protein